MQIIKFPTTTDLTQDSFNLTSSDIDNMYDISDSEWVKDLTTEGIEPNPGPSKQTQKSRPGSKKSKTSPGSKKQSHKKIAKKEVKKVDMQIRKATGSSKPKQLAGPVRTAPTQDYLFTELISNTDSTPFNTSFGLPVSPGSDAGTILLDEPISMVSLSIAEQRSASNQILQSALKNYKDYALNKLNLTITTRLPEFVSGQLGVIFAPPDVDINSSNAVSWIKSRSTGSKFFPGTRVIKLVGGSRTYTISGQWVHGARSMISDEPIGRLIVFVYVPIVAAAVSTGDTSSVSHPRPYLDKPFEAILDVGGHFLFRVPTQELTGSNFIQVRQNIPVSGRKLYYDQNGPINSFGYASTGQAPLELAEAAYNTAVLRYQNKDSISTGFLGGVGYIAVDGIQIPAVITAMETLAPLIDYGLEFFELPPVCSIAVVGAKAFFGQMDQVVGNVPSIAQKFNLMKNLNDTDNSGAPSVTSAGGLSGANPVLNPSSNPNPLQLPYAAWPWGTRNVMATSPASSAANNDYQILNFLQGLGFYTDWILESATGSTPDSWNYSLSQLINVFMTHAGGVSSLLPIRAGWDLMSYTGSYAGIPLISFNDTDLGSASIYGPSTLNRVSHMVIRDNTIRTVSFYLTLEDALADVRSLDSQLFGLSTAATVNAVFSGFFETEAFSPSGTLWNWNISLAYGLLGVLSAGQIDPTAAITFTPRPPHTGVISIQAQSNTALNYLPLPNFIERASRNSSDNLAPFSIGALTNQALIYSVSL